MNANAFLKTKDNSMVIYSLKRIFPLNILAFLFCALSILHVHSDAVEGARLAESVNLSFGGHQVSLAKGTSVQVLKKNDGTVTISVLLPDGSPLVTQIASDQLVFSSLEVALPAKASSLSVQQTSALSAQNVARPTSSPEANSSEENSSTKTNGDNQLGVNDNNSTGDNHPDFSATLSSLDATLPQHRYTALHGFFYVLINGKAVPVVYSLPMDNKHLAKSASNLIFYGPHPGERTDLTGNIVPKIVENLGCSVFSFSFRAGPELNVRKTCYYYKESGWFDAVLSARDEIIKGFGLDRKKLILMGYSGGGGMVLNFAGAFPDEVEAVAAQGANLAPEVTEDKSIKWLIVNNRGETNSQVTIPFYNKLRALNCNALYCETTPARARGDYHMPSGQAFDLIYSFIAGVLNQRMLTEEGKTDVQHLWPYAAPRDSLKRYAIVKTSILNEDVAKNGSYDLLPSAPFALNWSKVCPPTQTFRPSDGAPKMHINFPSGSVPLGIIIYFDRPTYTNISRMVEDVNSLAEHGYLVLSPSGRPKPEEFAQSAVNWIDSQSHYNTLRIHLLGYGVSGANFISSVANNTNISSSSISLVDFEDSEIDEQLKANIEMAAKKCGMYGFYIRSNSDSTIGLSQLADDLITTASKERGCYKVFVKRNITSAKLSSDETKNSEDKSTLDLDANKIALDIDKMPTEGKLASPQAQDQALEDQNQAELDYVQMIADRAQAEQDQRQSIVEERKAEDDALEMVKTLITKSE